MHTAVIAAINILVIRNSRLGRSPMVIRRETPSRLCVRDGSREGDRQWSRAPRRRPRAGSERRRFIDGFHVRFGSMACSVVTSKTPWPAGSSQSSTSAYQSLSRALRKRAGLNSFSRMSRLAPAAISSLSSTLPMLLLPSKLASCLRYVPTAVYTRIRAHACGIAALTAARIELPTVRRASRSRCARAASASG